MTRLRLDWRIGLLAIGLLSLFAVRASSAQELVRVGVGVDPVFTAWWIADEKGFFKKYGIKAEITQFSGGPALGDATMDGEVDIGSSGTATWMPRLVRGSMVVLARMAASPDAFKMAALTGVKSLEGLRGKKVGSVGGSSTDYLWYLVTKKLNLPENGVEIVPMQPPELVPTLDRRDIEAFFCWEPWPSKAVQISGKDKVHLLANSGDIGYFLNFIVVSNQKFVTAHPETTVKVLAALRDAIAYLNANPAEAIAIGAARNKLTPEMSSYVLNLYKYALEVTPEIGTAAAAEEQWMRSKERLKGSPIDWNKVIERQYFDRAMALN